MRKTPAESPVHPSVRLARHYLETVLRNKQYVIGERLPALRVLAKHAQVSPASMLSALHLLAGIDQITIIKNHGIFVGKSEDRIRILNMHSLPPAPKEKWQRLRIRMEQDIYAGRFGQNSHLPSLRDLAPKYGTSAPTMRKAMVELEKAGVLELDGRAYRLPRPKQLPGQAAILFTAYLLPEEDSLWFRRDRYLEFFASLHRACAEMNLRLLVASYHPQHGFRWRGSRGVSATELNQVTIRGHMVWAPALTEKILKKLCADLGNLQSSNKTNQVGTSELPLAILDGARGATLALPKSKDYSATRIFSIARNHAGEEVGRSLLRAGHRRIAYLSACHLEPWSKDRLEGLEKACIIADFPDVIRSFTVAARDNFPEQPHLPVNLAEAENQLNLSLKNLEKQLSTRGHDWLTMPLRSSVEMFRTAMVTAFSLQDQVKKMLASGATACIASNDAMAIFAIHELRKHGIKVPEDIAIVGFDDDKYAAANNLTSYNFNMGQIAGNMLHYLVAPEKAPPADENGVFECQGLLIERGSSKYAGKMNLEKW
jgi:DNA-binding LacI/PurR family transcriptional regulator/DNA-binding transcriptional regulator YhcF (GntR family)